jgi:hypothetical protein
MAGVASSLGRERGLFERIGAALIKGGYKTVESLGGLSMDKALAKF